MAEYLYALRYRLLGRCWAQGCGRRMLLHTLSQARRCEDTPIALTITKKGWAYAVGCQPEDVRAAASR